MSDPYPKHIELPDGTDIELRRMTSADRDALLTFAQALPEEDLLFLRVDLTQESVVDDWLANVDSGRSHAIVAYDSSGLSGYAVVHSNPTSWHRHLGEIRVNVSPAYRKPGPRPHSHRPCIRTGRHPGSEKTDGAYGF